MTPRLPHHRANLRVVRDYPRIDERRDDPAEREAIGSASSSASCSA